jgi:hypothetical protein
MSKRYSLKLAADPDYRDGEIEILNFMAGLGTIKPLPHAGGHDEMVFEVDPASRPFKALLASMREVGLDLPVEVDANGKPLSAESN